MVEDLASQITSALARAKVEGRLLRLTNTKQAQLPSEERVGDVLRDSEEVIAVLVEEPEDEALRCSCIELHPNRSAISTPRPGAVRLCGSFVVVVLESPPGRSSNPASRRPSGSPEKDTVHRAHEHFVQHGQLQRQTSRTQRDFSGRSATFQLGSCPKFPGNWLPIDSVRLGGRAAYSKAA
eukprot:symbB.v1.2.031011.t1/scaffold3554.1/size54204/4